MILYSQATQIEKNKFLQLVKAFLHFYISDNQPHYHIKSQDRGIFIMECLAEPPSTTLKENFQDIMLFLKNMGLLDYSNRFFTKVLLEHKPTYSLDRFFTKVSLKNKHAYLFEGGFMIFKFNIALMESLLDVSVNTISNYPPLRYQTNISIFLDVSADPTLSDASANPTLDEQKLIMQIYMPCLSPALQTYIKKCLQENFRQKFNVSSNFLKNMPGCGITFERNVEIPVRLEGEPCHYYELYNLLKLRRCMGGILKSPYTRQRKDLVQIIPANDIFEQTQQNILQAQTLAHNAIVAPVRSGM